MSVLTQESLAWITNDRIAQNIGLRSVTEADEYVATFASFRLGFRDAQPLPDYNFISDAGRARILSDYNVTALSRGIVAFGVIEGEDSDDLLAIPWVAPGKMIGEGHDDVVNDFLETINGQWQPASHKDAVGGAVVRMGRNETTLILDNRFHEYYQIPQGHLDALERASGLLSHLAISVAHVSGEYTIFRGGNRRRVFTQ